MLRTGLLVWLSLVAFPIAFLNPVFAGDTYWLLGPSTPGDYNTSGNWTNGLPASGTPGYIPAGMVTGNEIGLPGMLTQTGGSITATSFDVFPGASYYLSNANVEVSRMFRVRGTLDGMNAPFVISAPVGGVIDVSGPDVLNCGSGSIIGGPNSLIVHNPANPFQSINSTGFVMTPASTVVIPAGRTLSGNGEIPGHVDCQGTVSDTGTSQLKVTGGFSVSGSGWLDLKKSAIDVTDDSSSISDGKIDCRALSVVGTGAARAALLQSGGDITIDNLGLSVGTATYDLSGGSCSVAQGFVTVDGIDQSNAGVINHSAGSLTLNLSSGHLWLGTSLTGHGAYNLGGTGVLTSWTEQVGQVGHGLFTQTGGTNNPGQLVLGATADSEGVYDMRDGQLLCDGEIIVGQFGDGALHQSGGTISSWTFWVGYFNTPGECNISGGSFTTDNLYVTSTGALNITDAAADISVSTKLYLNNGGRLLAVPGSTVHMTGSEFMNQSTHETDVAGLENITLIYEDQTVGTIDLFEVAGTDLGCDPLGLVDNFAMGGLVLDDKAHVRLVDNFDNGNRNGPGGAAEALYLKSLTLLPGSTLDLNNYHLYVLDMDCQGSVLNGTVSAAPEPATMLLLGTGLVSVLGLRRRRAA